MDLRKNEEETTLIFLVRKNGEGREVLLAKKVKKKVIVDRFTGFGGSLDNGESPRKCAIRELREESGFLASKKDLKPAAIITFHAQREDEADLVIKCFVFILEKWTGKLRLKEDEMAEPEWCKAQLEGLPFNKMPLADIFWVPQIFDGKLVKGDVWYGPNQKTLTRTPEIRVVESLGDIG